MSAPATRAERGAWAEDLACAHLEAAGLELLTRNYRCPRGEVDLVLRDGNELVMVEVRYRRRGALVDGVESVDLRKQRKLLATAEYYLMRQACDADSNCRIDVVSVSGDPESPRVQWIRDAISA